MDDVMTIPDAARELGMTPAGVWKRIKRGEMKATQPSPKLWLIPRKEVERWRDRGKLKPGPKPGSKRTRTGDEPAQ
jgi:excisionase family DNA binding protein